MSPTPGHCTSAHPGRYSLYDDHVFLTHCDRVTYICFSNLTVIGSDNVLSPSRCQDIIWANAGILLNGQTSGTFIYFHSIKCIWKKCVCKMAAIMSRPQCIKIWICHTTMDITSGVDITFIIFIDYKFWRRYMIARYILILIYVCANLVFHELQL